MTTFLPGTLFLVDTSAATRAGDPVVAQELEALIDDGMIATCVFTDLEAVYSGRDPKTVSSIAEERRDFFRNLEITEAIARRARDVQVLMAQRGLHRAAGPIDLLVAAVAEHYRAIVLHYDNDFELIASVTGQRTHWIVPQGSVD